METHTGSVVVILCRRCIGSSLNSVRDASKPWTSATGRPPPRGGQQALPEEVAVIVWGGAGGGRRARAPVDASREDPRAGRARPTRTAWPLESEKRGRKPGRRGAKVGPRPRDRTSIVMASRSRCGDGVDRVGLGGGLGGSR